MNNKKKDKFYTIYGINNSKAVLESNKCKIREIFLDKNSSAYNDIDIKKILSNESFKKITKDFDRIRENIQNKDKRTQGIIINFIFLGVKKSIGDFFQNNKKDNCILILDQLEDPQNLGQIIRTCECAGVNKIILTQNRSVQLSNAVFQVSQGAFTDILFYICNNLRNTLKILKENDYWLVSLENNIDAKKWHEIDLKGNVGIILGSEGKGIRRLTLEESDFKATIPMQGKINSLNVSASCAAILFERLRQVSD